MIYYLDYECRFELQEMLGDPIYDIFLESYIKVDTTELTWYVTPTYSWLYSDKPILTPIGDIKQKLRQKKIHEVLKNK